MNMCVFIRVLINSAYVYTHTQDSVCIIWLCTLQAHEPTLIWPSSVAYSTQSSTNHHFVAPTLVSKFVTFREVGPVHHVCQSSMFSYAYKTSCNIIINM